MIRLMIWFVKKNQIVTELFHRGKKLNISTVFILQSYFPVPKDDKINCVHIFLMKISNQRELQQMTFNNSLNIGYEDFKNL